MAVLRKNHPALYAPKHVQNICKPLFQNSLINYFEYVKVYNNGKGVRLDTKNGFLPYLHRNNNYLDLNTLDKNNRIQFISMNCLPSGIDERSLSTINLFSNKFDLDNIFTFRKNSGDVLELASFGTSRGKDWSIANYYYSHIDYLENFIRYFKTQAKNIIELLEKPHNILTFNRHTNHVEYFSSTNNQNKSNIFINVWTDSYADTVSLTRREWDCMKLLAHGKTAKETAYVLNISYRTVESYIDTLKHKLHCTNKSLLADIYWLNKELV